MISLSITTDSTKVGSEYYNIFYKVRGTWPEFTTPIVQDLDTVLQGILQSLPSNTIYCTISFYSHLRYFTIHNTIAYSLYNLS